MKMEEDTNRQTDEKTELGDGNKRVKREEADRKVDERDINKIHI